MRVPLSCLNGSRGSRGRGTRGFTLVETSVALGIVGLLSLAGLSLSQPIRMDLSALQAELPGTIHQAKVLARASGRNVTVALGRPEQAPDVLPVRMSARVKWGKPAHVPLPKGMSDPVVADVSGESHGRVTLTPRHTATAATWFLNDGTDVLCMRLSGQGRLHLLRWRAERKAWGRV